MSARRGVSPTAWAVVWSLAATGSAKLVTLGGLALLARLLSPADFGLMGFALLFVTYAETVGDLGTGMALIYWKERRDEAAQVTFVFNLILGATWFALAWLGAPLLAAFFHNPEGVPILRGLAWVFPLRYLGTTHEALLRKDLRFRELLLPELLMALAKAVLAVALARAGHGVWSLVWAQLAGTAVWSALLWALSPWRPRAALAVDLIGPMLRYGRDIVAVNLLAAVVHHADKLVVGRMIGAEALGHYQMAYKLPETSIAVLIWVVGRVLFPAFSRIHARGESLLPAYLGALRYIGVLTLPGAVVLIALARPLLLALFGAQWEDAAPILRALAVYFAVRSLGAHAGDVLKAAGKPRWLAGLGVAKALLLVPALVVAGTRGPAAVALAMAAVAFVTVLLNLALLSRLLALRPLALLAALWPGLAGAAAMGLVLFGWVEVLGEPRGLLGLAAPIALALAVDAAAVGLADRGLYGEALARLRGRRPGAEPVAGP